MRRSMVRDLKPKLQTIASVVLPLGGTALVLAQGLLQISGSWTDGVTMPLFVAVPLLLLVGLRRLRNRRISTGLVSALLLSTLLFGILAQVATGVSPPDRYYLHDTATSGISPAGESMNATQGTTEATLVFDTVGQTAYWYVDETWPTGNDDFALSAGNYTFNMYFEELPRPWWNTSYPYRRPVNVTTGASAIPIDYPVNLTFDHASLVSQGKAQADGDDARIAFWNGTAWVEANRTVDPASVWNDNATKIWFEMKGPIGAGGFDANSFLYYGNATASNPPSSASRDTGVRFVQSGTVVSPGGSCPDPGGCTTTVTINPVNASRAFLLFNTRSNSNEPPGSFLRGRLNTSTTVEFLRVHDIALDINIQWYVVEYYDGVSVQRGEITQAPAVNNETISPVSSVDQAFITWSKTPIAGDSSYNDNDAVLCEVTSTTTFECRTDNADVAHVIWWQVVEFVESADINVQKGSTSLIHPATSTSVTLGTAVDVNKTFVLAGYRTEGSGADVGRRMPRAQLTDSTTITIDRSASSNGENITEIVWQAVELTDGTFVQRGNHNFPSATGQGVVALATAVEVNRSAAFASIQTPGGQSFGRTPYFGDDIIGVSSATLALNGTHLTLDRDNTADAADIGWFVVEWEREKPNASLGSEETEANVQVVVSVYHARPDGTDAQAIVTSSVVVIDDSTANPLLLNVGSGTEQSFSAPDPRRLRLLVNVTAISGSARFVLAYNSTSNPTNLETPITGVRPLLSNPSLTPTSGNTTTNFNFTIDYAHPFGLAADVVRVNVSDAANNTYNNLTMSRTQNPEIDYFVQQSWAIEGSVNDFANAQSDADSGASALLVQANAGGGSIVVDAVSSDNTTSSPLTFSHTIGGGSNRLLVVLIGIEAPVGNTTINAVTYNGVSMTSAVQNVTGTSFHMRTAVYYMLNADLPSTGSYTVSVTASLGENIQAGAISVTGAAQQAPEATANSGDGQAGDDWIETQITTVTDGAWIFDVVGSGSAVTFTPNSGQTERFDVTGPSSGTASGTKEVATAGTEVINWTTDASSNRISHSLAAFAPASSRLLTQWNTTGIRSTGEDVLVLRYNLTSADDTFGVWVWDFAASDWRQRGTLDQAALSFFNYTLTTEEKATGTVRIRLNDTSDSGSTDLSIDYQLVNNTLWTTGVTYFVNTTLTVGWYSHFFWANDTNGVSNRTATLAGPTVSGGPDLSNFRLENATAVSRVGEQLDVDVDYFFLFNVTDADGWTDIGDDGNVSLRLWYDGDVATTTQRDPTGCEAVGANWTGCADAFSPNDLYAYANNTGGGGAVLDVALLVGDNTSLDPDRDVPLRDHLETTMGHNVTVKDDADQSYDPTTFDVLVISESVGSSSTAWLKTQVVGILTLEGANNDELEMGTGGSSSGGADTDINITDNTHYITQVFPTGVLTVTLSTNNLGSMSGWANDVNKLAHYDTTPTAAKLLEVEKGGVLQGGTNTSADRRVFYGAQHFGNLTVDGMTLFNRSLDWAAYNTIGGPGRNDTAWKDFGFALGAETISSVEVGVEWSRNNTAPILNVTVSWDGGSTWATNQTATNKSADDDVLEWLDFSSATAWTATKLSDANLRVRVGTNESGARLDYVTVRVVTRSELTFTEQTTGSNYRIELRYVDTTDPGNASLSEWSITEGSAAYNASASSQTAVANGYEFKLALKLGFQVRQANDPVNSTAGSYNDFDSWNGVLEATDGTEATTLQTSATGEHMEFGVYMYTNVTIGGDWSATGLRGQTVNSNTITVTYRSNDDFNLTIWFTTHLLKGGDTIDISNVQILAAADLNDNITSDTAFAGLGEANLVYILGSTFWYFPHETDANENTTTVQFSVSIPGAQAFGTYTAPLVIRIQQRPSG